jgi:chlorite dismutase
VTAGLTPETDYMFRVHARELTAAQAFLQEFRETTLGEHSRQTEALVGLVREAVYTPDAPTSRRN